MMAKVKKAQAGVGLKRRQYKRLGRIAEKNPERAEAVAERMKERATRVQRGKGVAGSVETKVDYPAFKARTMAEAKGAKNGKSFPDLNKDGKITKADILKGRGVIAKSGIGMHRMPDGSMMKNSEMKMGGKAAKQAAIAISMKKAGITPKKKMQYGGAAASMKPTSKVKKAQAGLTASNKRVGPIDPNGAWTKVQEQTIAGKKTPVSLKKDKQLGATKMKMGGKAKAKKK
jgi:hypothetical protein